jgi:hypothetical protein
MSNLLEAASGDGQTPGAGQALTGWTVDEWVG